MTDTATASAHEAIKADIEANDVVLFMKGTRDAAVRLLEPRRGRAQLPRRRSTRT